jgi:hypothetical protein
MKKLTLLLFVGFAFSNFLFGQLAFDEVNTLPVLPTFHNAVVFGDLDYDGDNDVIISGMYTDDNGTVEIISEMYFNDGTGVFTIVEDTPFPPCCSGDIDLADIDDDGDLDVFMTGSDENGLSIAKLFANDGSGNFTELGGNSFAPLTGGIFQQFVDVNNDGTQDLFITGQQQDETILTKLYLNDGNGNFTEHESGVENIAYCSFDFADIENDGDLDLLISGLALDNQGWPIMVGGLYLNDGNGNFTLTASPFDPILTANESSIHFADFDGDGDQDAIASGWHDTQGVITTIYSNDGMGNFTATYPDIPGAGDGALDIGDIDNDGDLDVLAVGIQVADYPPVTIASIYLNDGNANFTEGLPENYFYWMYEGSAMFTDINNNGKLDVYIAGRQKYENMSGVLISKLYKNSTITSVIEKETTRIKIYPNPIQNDFYIESPEAITKLEIHSIDGQLIREIESVQFSKKINLQDVPGGVYFITIKTDKELVTRRILKQ